MTMFPTSYQSSIWMLMVLIICKCNSQPTYKINVNEESPVGYVIGNIQNFVLNTFYDVSNYEVTIINKFFAILSNKDVVMISVIDLEKICETDNLCCNDDSCVVGSVVYISSGERKFTFKLEVEIKDINDNKPVFSSSSQSISIPENSKINTFVRVDPAIDNDVTSINKVQRYAFEEPTRTFHLDSTDLEYLKLVLQQPIDYESKNMYMATISACEAQINCTSQQLIINVEDMNDNLPKFVKPKYEIQVKEDFRVGNVLLQVKAIDIDGPKYNKTIYKLFSTHDRMTERFFRLKPETGEIILRSRLTASSIPEYKFKVSAMDAQLSRVGDNIDNTEVVIRVIDINDHKPKIEIVDRMKYIESANVVKIKIKENELPQLLIAFKVSDPDLNDNGKVKCDLKDAQVPLTLKPFEPSLYEIWSANQYDYEKDTMIRTMFECRDHGSPPKFEYRTIEINIEDVNEFAPKFTSTEYVTNLRENAPAHTHVLTVKATDGDHSAELTYSIEDQSALDYFTIDSKSGSIQTTSIPFDKEQIDYKSFNVIVTDHRDNPKTASVSVKIDILDVNDNDPVFILSSLQFFVPENKQIRTKLVGQLNATDRDRDRENSFIVYEAVRLYDHMGIHRDKQIFRVKALGDIETLEELDREATPNFTLTVKAQDRGSPPRFTLANATVYVRDVNDNRPQWQYPRMLDERSHRNSEIPMLNISENTDKLTLILKLRANDIDDGEAGQVSYVLQNHHEQMFALNATTGDLITVMAPLRYGQYRLQLMARDHGSPPLDSTAWLVINVLNDGKLANINLTIIIVMVATTVLISIFLIVAIICVRRRPRFQKYLSPPASEPANDASNQYFNHNHWLYHTDDGNMPPISDNESFMFLPQQFCTSNHPDQIAAMQAMSTGGSRPGSRMDYPLTLPSSNNFNTIDTNTGLQINPNIDILNGTLRSNNGFYSSGMPASMGMVLTGQELDGDSADSGKGASEVDLRLQHQLNIGNRNYTTMPFLHYSTATTSFGHYNNMAPNQYYSNSTNPRAIDSRFLTVNAAHLPSGRRVASPSNGANCQCFMLPEDDIIQINQPNGGGGYSVSTFTNKAKLAGHDKNCVYNGDMEMGSHFYSDFPQYGDQAANMKDYVVLETSPDGPVATDKTDVDKNFNTLTDNVHNNKNLFSSADKMSCDKNNLYSMGLAN